MHFGPIAVTPTITISGLGVDTNVFNELTDPKQDFVATLSPQAQFWLRLGRGRLTGNTQVIYSHFQTYESQRSLNTRNEIRVDIPLNRITAYAFDTFLNVRERPGYEIDARARRLENNITLGADIRAGSRTTVGAAVWRNNIRFDADELFLGTSLRETLNRKSDGVRLSVRIGVTPLTTFVVDAEAQRDRFEFALVRDADSVRAMFGFDFSPFTLITGKGRVGFRKYDPFGPGITGYRGLVAAADLGYTLLGTTRFEVHTERDISYSYDVSQPYYLQTGVGVTVTQKITVRWDLQFTGAQYRLAYQQVAGTSVRAARVDRFRTYGGGIGYTLGAGMRLGLNVDQYRRTSGRLPTAYHGRRVGASVSYGF